MLNPLRSIFQKPTRRKYRLFQIESSLDCSLNCVMCPWLEIRTTDAMMSWETFKRIAEYFDRVESVDLTGGGEPLKNPLLADMVAAAKSAGCEVGFSSNATRLTPQIAERLIGLELDWISFSVDAASAELYERIRLGARFNQVVSNIAMLRDLKRSLGAEKPRLMMVFVMMAGETENFHELPAFIDLAKELGVEQVIAKNLDVILKDGDDRRRIFSHNGSPEARVLKTIEAAESRARALGVGLRLYSLRPEEVAICEHHPTDSLFFNWEGKISPCITLAYAGERYFNGERIHAPCVQYGSIDQGNLDQIWKSPEYEAFRQTFQLRVKTDRTAAVDQLLGGEAYQALPPAPASCRACYYLYGI